MTDQKVYKSYNYYYYYYYYYYNLHDSNLSCLLSVAHNLCWINGMCEHRHPNHQALPFDRQVTAQRADGLTMANCTIISCENRCSLPFSAGLLLIQSARTAS